MENIELWIIGILLTISAGYYFTNKENKYWRNYFKEQYYNEKDKNQSLKKLCESQNKTSETPEALPLKLISPSFNKDDLGNAYQIGFNHGKHVAPFQKDDVVDAFCTADSWNKNINWE